MQDELTYADRGGYEFTTNLWCYAGGTASPVYYTPSEVEWAVEQQPEWIHFIWDGVDPDTKLEWDMDANLPLYTRDFLKYDIAGFRVGGVMHHPAEVEIVRASTPTSRIES